MKILYAWEWGEGFCHLARFHPICEQLQFDGHAISMVVKEPTTLAYFRHLNNIGASACPAYITAEQSRIRHPKTLSDVSHNLGYDESENVHAILKFWYEQFCRIRPDLVISDFGIAAAVMAKAMQIPSIRIGTGFECPPSDNIPPVMRYCQTGESTSTSTNVLNRIHRSLEHLKLVSDVSWSDILGNPKSTLLATIEQLDHYDQRAPIACYLGSWDQIDSGVQIKWPSASKPKVLAYLKPSHFVIHFLNDLLRRGYQVAVYGVEPGPSSRQDHIIYSSLPLNHNLLAPGCEFCVNNGNHGSTLRFLSLGVPVLACPLHIEQDVTAKRLNELALGAKLDLSLTSTYDETLDRMKSYEIRNSVQRTAPEISSILHHSSNAVIAQLEQLI